ncbi:PilZ domain-containing protein [Sphingomonas sp.]|uniref:PilZ domain-containing protein n=1 Tax=Sphingomonas sp. TaxID=28214 RepID=UPI0025DD1F26|nr:PilZ domain-containing protein [Sphingomonas sp.]MBV9529062.1 hypothetical protein [Sphingomonas sp.]
MRQAIPTLKVREPRIKTFVAARMRLGARWTDAFILNVSSRGLLVRSSELLDRGTYVELRRDDKVIVARVVWRSGSCAGLRAQDRVPLEAIVTSAASRPALREAVAVPYDRRRPNGRPREHEQERSRLRGRAMEFISVAIVGAMLSITLFSIVAETLDQPFARVRSALIGQASLPAESK